MHIFGLPSIYIGKFRNLSTHLTVSVSKTFYRFSFEKNNRKKQ